jgi:hypothetical protein
MNRKDERPSKISYERHLNQTGIPVADKKTNGGQIPDYVKYGTWLRVNNPDAFEDGYRQWKANAREEMK